MTDDAIAVMHIRTCGRCADTTIAVMALGREHMPNGWSDLVLSGRPFLGMLLCPRCIVELREFLTPKPVEVATAPDD